MINKPVVLVLGAGASQPYGFPTGWQLTHSVIKGLDRSDSQLYRILSEGCQFDDPQILHFRDDLDDSQHHSVDAFLTHRTDHLLVGKAAIAASLIPCEDVKRFSRRFEWPDAHPWYSYLLQQLDTRPERLSENRLAIVTFNYDRSLEYFLHRAFMARHRLTHQEAGELVNSIPVIHVHGSLGAPDFVPGGAEVRAYDTNVARRYVELAANNIQILSEVEADTPPFRKAFECLAIAETVCFVGFGYDKANMDHLNLNKLPPSIRYIGTGFHLSKDDEQFANDYLRPITKIGIQIYPGSDAFWVIQNAGVFR
jgi:hypothetical protein